MEWWSKEDEGMGVLIHLDRAKEARYGDSGYSWAPRCIAGCCREYVTVLASSARGEAARRVSSDGSTDRSTAQMTAGREPSAVLETSS
eukprot:ctg_100.g105